MRDRLIELIRNAKAAMKAENLSCDLARNMFVAEFLIANGVTVQEWISVKDRLPEENDEYFVRTSDGNIGTACCKYGRWLAGGSIVTHWMHLPKPPKGE